MDLSNNPYRGQVYNGGQTGLINLATLPVQKKSPVTLNSPMIERVHRSKPGCSSCGKKVA